MDNIPIRERIRVEAADMNRRTKYRLPRFESALNVIVPLEWIKPGKVIAHLGMLLESRCKKLNGMADVRDNNKVVYAE